MLTHMKRASLLLVALLLIAACGGSGGSTTTAPTTGAAAPASNATAAPAATQAPQASAAPAATAAGAAPAATSASAPTAAPIATTAADAPTAVTAELQVDKSKLAKELHIYNWADYLDPAVLADFEKEYGVKVSMDTYDNNEDMIAKVRPGNSGFDIAVPSDYAVQIMIEEKLIAPLDKSLLPNFGHLKKQVLDPYYDKGNVYSLPYNTGTTGIAYDKSKFTTPPDSWGVVFDPQQAEAHKGQFTMLDDEREVPGAALEYLGKNPNDTDPAELKKVEDILKAQKPLVSAYDTSTVSRKLASGEVVLAHCYNNVALQARLGISGNDGFSGSENVGFFIPKEGGTIWQDNAVIIAGSPNIYTAHVFLNYLLRPDVAAKNATFNGGISPNADGEKLLDPKILALYKEGFAPDEATYKRLNWFIRNDKTSAFTDLWTAVKGQ